MRLRNSLFTATWVLCLVGFFGNQAAAQANISVSAPPTGAAVVSNAHFQNVFVYVPSTPTETWDQHIKAFLGNDMVANSTNKSVDQDLQVRATSEALNAYVTTLTASRYFSFAQQYNISSVVFDGGVFASPGCSSPLAGTASPGYLALTKFVACEISLPFMIAQTPDALSCFAALASGENNSFMDGPFPAYSACANAIQTRNQACLGYLSSSRWNSWYNGQLAFSLCYSSLLQIVPPSALVVDSQLNLIFSPDIAPPSQFMQTPLCQAGSDVDGGTADAFHSFITSEDLGFDVTAILGGVFGGDFGSLGLATLFSHQK